MIILLTRSKIWQERRTDVAQRPYLDMHVAVQENVARLEVQVEQRWLHAMEKIHGQAGFMDDVELELPAEVVGGQQLLQGAIGHELHHNAQGLFAHPVDGHNVLELDLLHFGCLFNETIHIRAMVRKEKKIDEAPLITSH